MKKIISLVLAVIMVFAMGVNAFAEFVGSVGPVSGVVSARIIDENGNTIEELYVEEHCLVVTHITEIDEAHPDVSEEVKHLVEVYNKLVNGEMEIPYAQYGYDTNMIMVDLYDATFICDNHPAEIAPIGIRVELVLEANVAAGQKVCVMSYKDGKWAPIVSAVNNNDGTVTCVFEDFCPISISVGNGTGDSVTVGGNEANPNTGAPVMLGAVVAVSAAAVFASKRK